MEEEDWKKKKREVEEKKKDEEKKKSQEELDELDDNLKKSTLRTGRKSVMKDEPQINNKNGKSEKKNDDFNQSDNSDDEGKLNESGAKLKNLGEKNKINAKDNGKINAKDNGRQNRKKGVKIQDNSKDKKAAKQNGNKEKNNENQNAKQPSKDNAKIHGGQPLPEDAKAYKIGARIQWLSEQNPSFGLLNELKEIDNIKKKKVDKPKVKNPTNVFGEEEDCNVLINKSVKGKRKAKKIPKNLDKIDHKGDDLNNIKIQL